MLRRFAASFFALVLASTLAAMPARAADANIFVAASLVDVLEKLADKFETLVDREVTIVPGASSTLSRQILAGAPADFFISADHANAERVAKALGKQAFELFGNRLVIIAPDDFEGMVQLDELSAALEGRRLAIGDPAHVPAGIYAQEALESAGVWEELEAQLAPAGNVRAAVAFVANGAAPFGIVYKTDAAVAGVKIVDEIDEDLHTPIRYWSVLTNPDNVTADMFWSHIGSFDGMNRLEYEGFVTSISRHD